MKYMTMKSRNYAFNLQIFAEDVGSDGDDSGDEGDDQDDDDLDEGGDDAAAEKKYSDKDMEDAIKKRLARERRKWQKKQAVANDETGKQDDGRKDDSEDVKTRKAEEIRASKLEVKVACFEADVAKESVDDVAALAHAYMASDDDLDLEDAIEKVVKKYPQFKKGTADPYEDEEASKEKSWGQRQKGKGSKKTDGVEAAFIKRNPGLKI